MSSVRRLNPITFIVSGLLLLNISIPAFAQEKELTFSSGAEFVNHYPGPDGLIGNDDDVVSGDPAAVNGSAANSAGSLGHNSFDFGNGQDANLPTGYNAITFVNGTLTADMNVLMNGGGAILTGLNITSGTEPFPGHGAYTSTIDKVNSGTYDPNTGDFVMSVDYSYTINGNTVVEPNVELTGTAVYRAAADFGTPSGNDYVDNVAVPHAQANAANGVLFMSGSGQLTNLGYPITASMVALDEGGGVNINAGHSDAWYDPVTAGQGFFIIVWPDSKLVYLAWFTFDTERPPEDVTAILGEPGHRWLTALGGFEGNTANLTVYLTEGGVFDSAEPAPTTDQAGIGTITIVWDDCEMGTLTYDLPELGLMGSIEIQRIVPDNVALCQTLNDAE